MASPADETAASIGVIAADLDHDPAGRRAADLLVRIVASDTLHFMIAQQCFVDGLAGEACARPGRRNRGRNARSRHRIADLVTDRIIQLPVCGGQGGVVNKRDWMRYVQIRPDVTGTSWRNEYCRTIGDAAELVDGDRSIVTAQARFGSAIGLPDGGVQGCA